MTYERYDNLCTYYRGLKRLLNSNKEGLTPHQKFRILGEIKTIGDRIRRIDKILSIKTEGDWEFSTLAQNYVFWPIRPTDQTKYVNLSQWQRIKSDPELHNRYKAERRGRENIKRSQMNRKK